MEHFYSLYLAFIAFVVVPSGIFLYRRVPAERQSEACSDAWNVSCVISYVLAWAVVFVGFCYGAIMHGFGVFGFGSMFGLAAAWVVSCCAFVMLMLSIFILAGVPIAALVVLMKRDKSTTVAS
jgi:hypothetical protein